VFQKNNFSLNLGGLFRNNSNNLVVDTLHATFLLCGVLQMKIMNMIKHFENTVLKTPKDDDDEPIFTKKLAGVRRAERFSGRNPACYTPHVHKLNLAKNRFEDKVFFAKKLYPRIELGVQGHLALQAGRTR
jgi:hypothetical protein